MQVLYQCVTAQNGRWRAFMGGSFTQIAGAGSTDKNPPAKLFPMIGIGRVCAVRPASR
jgi:hypothetical protein